MRHTATDTRVQVFHYFMGQKFTAFELCRDHGHSVQVHGNSKEGFALFLADASGDVGLYMHEGTFQRRGDATRASWNALSVKAVNGLHYVNR